MNSKIWLSSPHMGGNELKYIHEAFDQNWVAPLGPNVTGFEEDLRVFLEEDVHVAALSSGTAALHLSLIMLGVKRDDYVICQSMTFSASANPIAYLGANPVFVDSENDTWNMCPIALENSLSDLAKKNIKPKAIIVVHLYGMPAKMDELIQISKKYDVPLIEDAAEALGSKYKGRNCGTFGEMSILSFNGNKIITTSGGGALVVNDIQHKDQAIFLSTQARDDAPHYQHSQIGYNYRMSNISAGIGRGQMEVLKDRIQKRREINQFYKNVFKNIEGVTVHQEKNDDFYSNHWLSAVVINPEKTKGITRETLRLKFLEQNIESRPLWKPMHLQPVFKESLMYGGEVSEQLFNNGLCLPSGSSLSEDELERIKQVIINLF